MNLPRKLSSLAVGAFALGFMLMSGFSDAQAAPVIIDTFDSGNQSSLFEGSIVVTPSAIGGERLMTQTGEPDVQGGVANGINFATHGGTRFDGAGTVITEWNGQGEDSTLEGADLTDFGRNGLFDITISDLRGGEFGDLSGNTLTLIITDSSNVQSSVSREWEDLEEGRNFIPFSDFSGGVDFRNVDIIRLEQRMANPGFDPAMEIDRISAVPSEPASTTIVSANFPASRSVQVGNLASAFALIINASDNMAMDCGIEPLTEVPAEFIYQTTDASNIPVGMPNTRVDIEPEGSQNFVFAFTPTAPISPTDVQLSYDCSNSEQAPVTSGVNTLLLSASNDPVPDIVALAATPSNDGILNLPGANGSSAFSVAATNFGSADMITASAVPSMALPISLLICETNPATAECISGPASSVASMVDTGATPTYSIFVTANGTVPFVPEANRIIVEFRDAGDVVRGSTSVAVRTQ